MIEHSHLDLVAVRVYDPDKVGRDAGELAGVAPTGVVATAELSEIVAAAPDCVLYMARACDCDDMCALLEAGINVVTTRGEFHRPASMDPGVRARIEKACATGGASIHSTGSSPGFITEALPLVLTSIQRRLDHLAIEEFADLSKRPSPELLFDLMGFGRPPAAVDPGRVAYLQASFGPSLELVAETLSMPLDSLEASGAVAVATHRTEIAAGVLEAGTVAAQQTTVSGIRGGRTVVSFEATWYCTKDIDADWELRDTGWRVKVDGDAPLDIDLRFAIPLEQMAQFTPGYTANRAVNAVAVVCAAEPGIKTTVDLPQVIARLSGS